MRDVFREAYIDWAREHMSIDMDGKQTYAEVPSEQDYKALQRGEEPAGITYRVDIDESDPALPHAINCKCCHFSYRHAFCKHMQVVEALYLRLFLLRSHKAAMALFGIQHAVDVIVRDAELDHAYEALGPELQARSKAFHAVDDPIIASIAPKPELVESTAEASRNRLAAMGLMRGGRQGGFLRGDR